MALQPPTTLLREVESGLRGLARELEEITGEPPANLLWWGHELREVIEALEHRHPAPEHRIRPSC